MVIVAGSVITMLQLVVLAMATSHGGLAEQTMIKQRYLATACSAIGVLFAGFPAVRRRLPRHRHSLLLTMVGVSLVGGAVLVGRDAREWDPLSVEFAALTISPLLVCVWLMISTTAPSDR